MNGIEKITARIQQDAEAEIQKILAEAEEKAKAIRSQYEAQAKAETVKAAEAAEKAALQLVERGEGSARMEAKKVILSTKQGLIDKAFVSAQQQLLQLPQAEYVELLARIAVNNSRTGKEEILLNGRDKEAVGDKVVARANQILAEQAAPECVKAPKATKAGKILDKVVTGANAILQGTAMLSLGEETREISGGLILRQGNVEVNCAFETQLRFLREELTAQVAHVLFH